MNEIIQSVRNLSRGLPPKSDISELLRRHGCAYLLTKVQAPAEQQQRLLERVVNNVAIKERFKACAPLFAQSDIPYAVIKGAVLSQAMYRDPLIRASGDIDLLIRRQDADKIKQLFLENGFVQGRVTENGIVPFTRRELLFQASLSHQTAPYVKATGNKLCPYVNVDVNMDILWGESGKKADMEYVLAHTEQGALSGFTFQKLTPEMEFLALCLHHYKDLNSLYLLSGGSFRLGLFCEIYDYLRAVKPDVATLCGHCEALQVGAYLHACIEQTQQIFDDPQLTPYLDALACYRNEALENRFGLNEKERKSWGLNLFERLLHPNLPAHILTRLSEEEKEKVKINRELM